MKKNSLWLVYAIIVMVFWGVWGAFAGYPEDNGFPATLSYIVWSLTMIPPAIVALFLIGWKLEYNIKSICLGLTVGLLGAAGQLILLPTLGIAPGYLVFSYIALSPLVTILLALLISREKAATIGWIGIILALIAGVLLSVEPDGKSAKSMVWVFNASLILVAWGIQGFVISYANNTMKAESIFFYMMLGGVVLIPVAISMTDFNPPKPINWGLGGPWLAALIHPLNAIGALLIVYAFRYGKAIIIAPMTNAGAPVITIIISLTMILMSGGKSPYWVRYIGMALAVVAAILMTWEGSKEEASEAETPSISEE